MAPMVFGTQGYKQGCKFCIFGQPGCEPKKVKEPKTQEEGGKKQKKEEKGSKKKREWKKLEKSW